MLNNRRKAIVPKLTLVGAGPGDPELLTIKAHRVLQAADVVLYDALVHPDTLSYIPPRVLKRFVGKRAGKHFYSQQEINELIVQDAYRYGHVVRLKGGDPFVFGRGQEEIIYAENHGIATAVIPGVSSATALPSLHKMPLTVRGRNESFWVLTGCTSNRKISSDIAVAAGTNATAVVLMGLRKIGDIMAVYKTAGKPEWPVAIIINGSLDNERVIRGRVNTIEEAVRQQPVTGPALIVIGEAADSYAEADLKAAFQPQKEFSYQEI